MQAADSREVLLNFSPNIWAPLNDLRYHPRCPKGRGPLVAFVPAPHWGMRRAGEIEAIQRRMVACLGILRRSLAEKRSQSGSD